MDISLVLTIFAIPIFGIYNVLYLHTCSGFLVRDSEKNKIKKLIVPTMVNLVVFFICFFIEIPIFLSYVIMAFVVIMEAVLFYSSKMAPSIVCGSFYMINLIVAKMMVDSLYSTFAMQSVASIQKEAMGKSISILLTCILLGVVGYIVVKVISPYDLEMFANNKIQISFSATISIVMVIYLVLTNVAVSNDENFKLLNLFHMTIGIFTLIAYYALMSYGIKISKALWFKMRSKSAEEMALAEEEFEMSMYMYNDKLTGLNNREFGVNKLDEVCQKNMMFSITFIYVDKLSKIRREYGDADGDFYVLSVSEALKSTFRTGDILCRMADNEFMVILPNCPVSAAEKTTSRAFNLVNQESKSSGKDFDMAINFGAIQISANSDLTPKGVLELSESKMSEFKVKKNSLMDQLTGLFNQNFALNTMENLCYKKTSFVVCMFSPKQRHVIEQKYGEMMAEEYLKDIVFGVNETFRASDTICRFSDNLIAVVIPKCKKDVAEETGNRAIDRVLKHVSEMERPYGMDVEMDLLDFHPKDGESPSDMYLKIKSTLDKFTVGKEKVKSS